MTRRADSAETDSLPALQRIQTLPSWLLGRVATRGRALVADAIAVEGAKMWHHAVLAAVCEYGPIAQAELGRRISLDPKDLVGFLNDLQAEGYVMRKPDPDDRRKNAVSVTKAGERMLARCAAAADRANEELLAPLSAAERKQLMELLRRIGGTEV
ncbi:MarR family winged helix-turn-helix transcriptional regulator [Streptomyces sp. CBMA152]|uniref:MarR family winged helix-turn-helix transcriptional regulator n=1 Tax=Streptomyces sp. CBMA152 TaxID=1896312 RepID=UPI0016617D69|nr:MarR family winged helix-turn-helix transcriptional regulator [Streptomyces sp. CBMA152]MBD0741621.1 MarR family transcriptional regulator [Streptomyces sp. CBMA152]